jgi:hypothetical protein
MLECLLLTKDDFFVLFKITAPACYNFLKKICSWRVVLVTYLIKKATLFFYRNFEIDTNFRNFGNDTILKATPSD